MRRTGYGRLLALALAGIVTLLAGSASAQTRIGSASAVSNQVEGVIGRTARTLAVGSEVHLNELVRTGDASTARLVFLDDTNLGVGPRSEVRLDRFVYNPNRSAGKVVVRTGRGVFRFATGSQRPQNYRVETPVASIGVRGTVFDLAVTRDRMVVTLISGRIIVTTPGGRTAVLATPGESLTVYVGGTIVRRADWGGAPRPDFAALFGPPEFFERSSLAYRGGPGPGRITLGLALGGAAITQLPTASSSGFYSGGLEETAFAPLISLSLFTDVARYGNPSQPFGNLDVSIGVLVDDVIAAPLQWTGLCGGVVCRGSGHLSELDVLAALRLATWLSSQDSANVYFAGGLAALWPSGTPTGIGGPAFVGSATAPALQVGVGFDRRFSEAFSAGVKLAVQHVFPTEFDTTLAGERFRFDGKTEVFFAVVATFSP